MNRCPLHATRHTLAVLLAVLAVASATARSHYATIYNRFSPLCAADSTAQTHINGNYLLLDNATTRPLVLLDTALHTSADFTYSLRFANRHSRPDATYRVGDSATGQQHRVKEPYCGMVFAYVGPDDWWGIAMKAVTVGLTDDRSHRREMSVALFHHTHDGDSMAVEQRFADGFDVSSGGVNTLCLTVNGDHATLQGGHRQLADLFSFVPPVAVAQGRVGCLAGSGAEMAVDRTALLRSERTDVRQQTGWTVSRLDSLFAASHDPLEGFYTYLDRDLDDRHLRLGGRYTLAVMAATDGGYDIVYIDGAQVMNSQWSPGMFKGHLSPTIFTDHYDLQWIDATFQPIDPDAYATIEQATILTLHFPLYKSQLRLAKRQP